MNWEPFITEYTFKHEYLYAHVRTGNGSGLRPRPEWTITDFLDPNKKGTVRACGFAETEELARSAAEVIIKAIVVADAIALPHEARAIKEPPQ